MSEPEKRRDYHKLVEVTSAGSEGSMRHVEDAQSRIFSDRDIYVRITDVVGASKINPSAQASCTSTLYDNPSDLEKAILNTSSLRIRVITVYSQRTIAPLQITWTMMQKLLVAYNVHPNFLSVLLSFGDEPHLAEGSGSNIDIEPSPNGQTKISYQIRYVQENHRRGRDPWSLRHTGIYHSHSTDFDLWIILQPVQDCALVGRLSVCNEVELDYICEDPFQMHQFLFSSYFDNWRWYLRYIGQNFEKKNDIALTLKPDTPEKASLSLECVQSLRNMQDATISCKAYCSGNLYILSCLLDLEVIKPTVLHGMRAQAAKLRGYVESCIALQGRIQNAIDLTGYVLNLQGQVDASKINQHLLDLTQDTVDDSTTVKIITFVTAFYLPGSFVATLFGMNFFLFNEDSQTITIAHDFWIFLVSWLPLTVATGAICAIIIGIDVRRKRRLKPEGLAN